MNIIQQIEKEQVEKLSAGKEIPDFAPGDTVLVNVKVVEGDQSRVQAYEGVCIGRSGGGINESFTVRKISYGEGVERVFPLYSPMIDSIKVVRRGKVRRAKLYYLRGRRGKKARISEASGGRTEAEETAARRVEGTAGSCGQYAECMKARRRSRPPCVSSSATAALTMSLAVLDSATSSARLAKPRTLYDKIWDDHLVDEQPDGTCLIYIDRHLVHEVTSPQAFEGLRTAGRKVRAPDKTLAVVDHNVPTTDRISPIPIRNRPSRSRRWRRTPRISASNISTSSTSARASSTSSARSRASPCPAPRSCAATATPRRMAPSARSPTASAPRKSSTCWRRRR